MKSQARTILLTGINGQVGSALLPPLKAPGEVVALDRQQLDLASPNNISKTVRAIQPDIIVNPVTYTAVRKAEAEPALAHAINAVAPGVLAEEAARCNALLVHYSTDYVFDGNRLTPYPESDTPHPLGVYGASKLAGEQTIQASHARHLILRTSWVHPSPACR